MRDGMLTELLGLAVALVVPAAVLLAPDPRLEPVRPPPDARPLVRLQREEEPVLIEAGSPFELSGSAAWDFQEAEPLSTTWISSLDGPIGSGVDIQWLPEEPGSHTVALVARAGSAYAVAVRRVEVVPEGALSTNPVTDQLTLRAWPVHRTRLGAQDIDFRVFSTDGQMGPERMGPILAHAARVVEQVSSDLGLFLDECSDEPLDVYRVPGAFLDTSPQLQGVRDALGGDVIAGLYDGSDPAVSRIYMRIGQGPMGIAAHEVAHLWFHRCGLYKQGVQTEPFADLVEKRAMGG